MLLRLAYLTATTTLTLLRLLPMRDRDKDLELLALRHLLLLVRPDTLLRWHRDLLRRRHAATCAPPRRGRPPTIRSIRSLVLRLARENSSWGYRRIHGELAALGIKIAASTVGEILREHGIPPAPGRQSTTWADFLRSQADALLACDFFEARTLTGARLYVFAVIEQATRRIRILGATAHPTAQWAVQLGRNLVMDLEDAGARAKFLIRDRDSKFTPAFDAVLHDAGLRVVTTGVRVPRMNSIMERWVQTCRHELLDRSLIWNQRHLLQVLHEFERFYNGHRPVGVKGSQVQILSSRLAKPQVGGRFLEFGEAAFWLSFWVVVAWWSPVRCGVGACWVISWPWWGPGSTVEDWFWARDRVNVLVRAVSWSRNPEKP